MDMEEREDPQPLTDEELAEFEKKERNTGWFIESVIDLILSFFH